MLSIIGCGNPNRSDDGVGVVVAHRLRERFARHPVPGVQVFETGTAGMEVMFAARGSDALVIVDACRSGSEPGAVFRVPGEEIAKAPEPSFSLHDFRWDHAIHAGRRIFGEDFPTEVDVFLVEAASIELGLELSAPVARAADEVYRQVLARVGEYAAGRHHGRAARVELKRGRVVISAEDHRDLLGDAPAVLVLQRDGQLVLVPIEEGYGGSLVKTKNARGDRVIDVAEGMRQLGLDEWTEQIWEGRWHDELAGLALKALTTHR